MSTDYNDSDIVLSDGEVVAEGSGLKDMSTDDLIREYQFVANEEKQLRNARMQITEELACRSPQTDGCRTTRLHTESHRVKIEWPEDSWDQAKLKEAWHAYPQFCHDFMAIGTLRVKLRECKKLLHERGAEPFEMFRSMLLAANKGPCGSPRIVIEDLTARADVVS